MDEKAYGETPCLPASSIFSIFLRNFAISSERLILSANLPRFAAFVGNLADSGRQDGVSDIFECHFDLLY